MKPSERIANFFKTNTTPQIVRIAIIGLLMILLGVLGLCAQDKVVSGLVLDENGEPAIGASVMAQGTNAGGITDLDGKFSFKVPPKAKKIQISYVGYKTQTLPVSSFAGGKALTVKLQPSDQGLEEVVVIGYGTSKRGDLTDAVSSVKSDKFDDRENENVLGSLQGQLAGVEITNASGTPGGDLEVHIRGAASINASDAPLYVVDGIPVDDLSDLNPNDIGSIDVLKDASSAAIYGSRGANGVILVTTKKAAKGEKVNVTFQSQFGLQQVERKMDVMSAEEWMQWRSGINNAAYVKQFGASGADEYDDYDIRMAHRAGSFSTTYMNDPRWSMPNYGGLALIDWQDECFRIAPKQNYSLSVSGTMGQTSYRATLGYSDTDGVVLNSNYTRLTARINLTTRFWDRVTFGMNLAPSLQDNKGAITNVSSFIGKNPVAEPEAGIYTCSEPYDRYTWASNSVSPVATLEQTKRASENFRMTGSAFLRVDILPGFNAEVTGSYSFQSRQWRTFIPSSISYRWSVGEGYYATGSREDNRSHKYLLQGLLNYSRQWGEHNFKAMAGASMESTRSYSSRVQATHFPDNLSPDFALNKVDLTTLTVSTGYPVRMASYFGRVVYDYDAKYFAQASIRCDGSSRFGRLRQWGWFPAFSAAWRVSRESFWPEDFFMNNLKVRASWGATGNNSIHDGSSKGLLGYADYSFGDTQASGYAPSTLEAADLTWEKVYSWNWGVDFGFFNNRLQISVDYYRKNTTDLLYQVTIPAVSGFTKSWANVGSVFNQGVDLEVSSVNLVKPLKWTTTFTLGYNRNKVTSLGDNETVFINSNMQVLMIGQPLRSYYLYDAVGVYMTEEDLHRYPTRNGSQVGDVRYRDVNDDGVIDDNDRTLVGKPSPDFTFGMTNKFNWRGFDLSFTFTAQTGGYLYNYITGRTEDNPGMAISGNCFSWWLNCWKSEDDPGDGKTPAIDSTTGELRDTRWLYKTDYLRLKNITIGYRIPIPRKNKYFKSIRVSFSVENVARWDSFNGGYCPENKGNNIFPMSRIYTLGLNANF